MGPGTGTGGARGKGAKGQQRGYCKRQVREMKQETGDLANCWRVNEYEDEYESVSRWRVSCMSNPSCTWMYLYLSRLQRVFLRIPRISAVDDGKIFGRWRRAPV